MPLPSPLTSLASSGNDEAQFTHSPASSGEDGCQLVHLTRIPRAGGGPAHKERDARCATLAFTGCPPAQATRRWSAVRAFRQCTECISAAIGVSRRLTRRHPPRVPGGSRRPIHSRPVSPSIVESKPLPLSRILRQRRGPARPPHPHPPRRRGSSSKRKRRATRRPAFMS